MFEYDPVGALGKPTILKYFQERLWPSIQVKLKHQDLELEGFDQLIKKVVKVKRKALRWLYITTWEIDQHCSRDSQLGHITIAKVSTSYSVIKDLWVEEPKTQDFKLLSGPQCFNKSSDKVQKEKKKK